MKYLFPLNKLNFNIYKISIKNKIMVLVGLLIISCQTQNVVNKDKKYSKNQFQKNIRDYDIQAVLWQQLAAEHRALSYQAFNLAKLRLDTYLTKKKSTNKPLAIITDIDETIFDNSPFNAKMIKSNTNYTKKNWAAWVKLEKATPIPGSLKFLLYAASKGVEIYYISNRSSNHTKETVSNLKQIGFPITDKKHILLKDSISGKETRRQIVYKTKNVIMLLGDNLSDFSDLFDNKSTIIRNKLVDSLHLKFGNKFIVLPNPMYGDWETKGIYEGRYNLNSYQKDSIRKAKLIAY
ncbi:5'-nucleotidase, lipoprotein e(P4) family [Lutibacter sp.]|uniref:5'-nucleotidase, lipoprotein e(P4) family n=1 Tax=Lutibacter sp. TaxID=1925666 RepID=UPI0025B9945A|nr:5'-nucleotidase, lipoprotein e(P4) family [Lutibacter sp.]MCF6182495.1 5'-nucleotidase, lipoprotein e(P4) family [Lutibacter sp.]